MAGPDESGTTATPLRGAVALAAVMALGAAVRLAGWGDVFTTDGVRFLFDSDPHYHVLQARRLLVNGFQHAWFDPWLSWPAGAPVLWPPLWDLLIAGVARLLHGPAPTPQQVERVGALLPVAVGVLTLPLVAALARRLLGPGREIWAALLVALLGGNVWFTYVGRADQHGLETLLGLLVLWGFAGAALAQEGHARWTAAIAGGVGVTLAFWNWMGSAVDLAVPVAAAALAHAWLERNAARRMAWALAAMAGTGALLLAASVLLWGAPGALQRGSLTGLSGLHVALAAGAAIFGVLLLAAGRVAPEAGSARRWLEVVLAAVVPAGALLAASPSIRAGVLHGLTALGAGNGWFENISEYRPLLFSCESSLGGDVMLVLALLGLTVPVGAVAVPSLVRRWRAGEGRVEILLLACWVGLFLPLALLRRRFAVYATPPLAVLAAEGLRVLVARLQRRPRWSGEAAGTAAMLAGAVLTVAPGATTWHQEVARMPADQVEAARWLGAQPHQPGRDGVATPWMLGHLFLYYGHRPVVASPFGTDVGPDAMAFTSRLHLTPDPEEVESMALERRLGWLVVTDPAYEAIVDQALAPRGTPRYATLTCSLVRGAEGGVDDRFQDLAVPRLFYRDGLTRPGVPAPPFTRLRLVYETPGLGTAAPPETSLKIFQVVPGATVRVDGAAPGAMVRLETTVTTPSGRGFDWSIATAADPDGSATFRVPYASGANGASRVSPWTVTDGTSRAMFEVRDGDIMAGGVRRVHLGGP